MAQSVAAVKQIMKVDGTEIIAGGSKSYLPPLNLTVRCIFNRTVIWFRERHKSRTVGRSPF